MKRKLLLSALVLMFFLAGCGALQVQTQPKDILYQAESLYLSQQMDYMSFFGYDTVNNTYELHPWVTEEEKTTLRERKKVLDKFKDAILAYRAFINRGEAPNVETEQSLISFIRQFQRGG